jgi:alpha-beta hydrolase superfamily lysophospholipase
MTMGYTSQVIPDAAGVGIHVYRWEAPQPKATLHIAHGAGEHALRWTRVAEALASAGYSVVADDHRGHGRTGEEHLGLSALGHRSTRAAIDAVQLVGQQARDQVGDRPLILLGHSWGSLMAQKMIARSSLYDGAVLSGTSLAVPGVINIGDLNKRWRSPGSTGLEWLSRDPAVGEAFAADPYCFDIAAQPVWSPLQAFAFLGRPPRRMPRDIPVLIQGGTDDALGGTRGLTMLRDAYRKRSRLSDVKLRLYRGARHEIYNEINRDEVLRDLIGWLNARFG